MAQSPDKWLDFQSKLGDLGLNFFGGFEIVADECPAGCGNVAGQPALLIGNAGQAMWEQFSVAPEYCDGQSDPMDRWTRRVLEGLAGEFDAKTAFPFEKPYWPFQRFAMRASGSNPSPLGILIHPEYGLWHAFRGAIIWGISHEIASQIKGMIETPEAMFHPCETCKDRPCLSACPVDAFDGETLDRGICHGHLKSGEEPDCMAEGCRARDACPAGTSYRYCDAQLQFHMQAYSPK